MLQVVFSFIISPSEFTSKLRNSTIILRTSSISEVDIIKWKIRCNDFVFFESFVLHLAFFICDTGTNEFEIYFTLKFTKCRPWLSSFYLCPFWSAVVVLNYFSTSVDYQQIFPHSGALFLLSCVRKMDRDNVSLTKYPLYAHIRMLL